MKKGKKAKLYTIISTIILLTLGFTSIVSAEDAKGSIVEDRYSTILSKWNKEGIKDVDGVNIEVSPSQFILKDGKKLTDKENSKGYNSQVLLLNKGEDVEFTVDVPKSGLYNIGFDCLVLSDGLVSNEAGLQVNGAYEYFEARRVIVSSLWENSTQIFPRDRYNNEVMPSQNRVDKWQSELMADASHIQPGALKMNLNQGKNMIKLALNSGELYLGNIKIISPKPNMSYSEYKQQYSGKVAPKDVMLTTEAEKYTYKNDTAINAIVSRDLEVSPYSTNELLLNTLGGITWNKGGQAVYYSINVPEDGLYKIGFKYTQSIKANSKVYRTITIDDKVPFKELEHYGFDYTNKWDTTVLGNGNEEYRFYLSKGVHTLGLEADSSIFSDVINSITDSLKQINDTSLQIKKLVGNSVDQNRDWEISDYMPNIQTDLNKLADTISRQHDNAVKLNNGNENSQGLISMNLAVKQLRDLAKEPNKIPSKLSQLSEGTGSAAQVLSQAMEEFESQPLTIDRFYVTSIDTNVSKDNVSIIKKFVEGIKRFIYSFIPKKTEEAKETVTLNVWVNRPRNYLDLMQKMADEKFTPNSKVKINFSLMPNEQKLILANASGTAPDIGLGISNWQPYELGIRGTALDLKQFKDFSSYIGKFSPGALIPMIADGKTYGIPETQDFYVLFYRKDILNSLGIPVPDTWDDVIKILPELQRYGMNFYSSLSSGAGSKPFMFTSPFIYQNGGDIFNKDGMSTALDSEASLKGIKFMTDLFTIYGLPQQVPNFYEHFRDGTLPIGVGTFNTYVQLMNAAPELKGSWAIAPSPGIKDASGNVVRWQPGSATAGMIFKNTAHPQEAWEFLKWWMDTDTQSEFANQLQTLYGGEYMWNTANLDAFKQLPWAPEDKQVVLEQWKWLREVPKIPGGYMAERELSNIWNEVVFDNKNPRAAVDDSVLTINKEIQRKMEEFKYMKNGKIMHPYDVPTIDEVESWVKQVNGNK